MRTGVIPILHKNCWASETCEQNPNIKLDVALYQVLSTKYKVLVQMHLLDTSSNDFLTIEEKVRRTIKGHDSTSAFDYFQKPDIKTKNAIYDITITDKGYSTSAARIMTRIEGVHLYPLVIMPVLNREGVGGIEYLKAIFDNEIIFNKVSDTLRNDPNITVLNEDPEFKSEVIEDHDKWAIQNTIYTDFLMQQDTIKNLQNLLSNVGEFEKFYEDTKFLEYLQTLPPKFIEMIGKITGLERLDKFYDMMESLEKKK